MVAVAQKVARSLGKEPQAVASGTDEATGARLSARSMLMRDWGACYYVFEKLAELLVFREAADYAAWCDADEATKAEEGSGALLKALGA